MRFDPLAAELAALQAQLATTHPPVAKRTTLLFGADKWGHDIVKKTIKGGETSIVVGLVAALVAVTLGTLFGAVAGFFGGSIDDLFNWFYSIFTSIPSILMILTVAAVLQQKGVTTIVLILGLTGWTGPFRLMRAEYIKHSAREYVMAANAIGASNWQRMFGHILPNVSHVALVQLSILVVGFIKAEVILSFLGFGVPVGTVSWGSMLNEAQNELILGKWWQLAAAAGAMAVLVTSFFTVHRRLARRARPQDQMTQDTNPLLRVRDLRIAFRVDRHRTSRRALKGVSFDVPDNSTVALVGESGSGKSVSSLAVMGLLPPETTIVDPGSRIAFDGRELLGLPLDARRALCGKDIAMIFQEPMSSLNPVLTVGFQIGEVLRQHMGMTGRQARAPVRSSCWPKWAFPIRSTRSTPIRARCPVASSSG